MDKSKVEHDETSRKKRNKAQMVYVSKEVHKVRYSPIKGELTG